MDTDTAKTKILFMDDESAIRGLAKAHFRYFGYSIEVVENGQEALAFYSKAIADNSPFHVVVLDIVIKNGMGGLETMQNLHEINPNIKGIAVSGYADPQTLKLCESCFKKFMAKPFTMNQLNIAVDELVTTKS